MQKFSQIILSDTDKKLEFLPTKFIKKETAIDWSDAFHKQEESKLGRIKKWSKISFLRHQKNLKQPKLNSIQNRLLLINKIDHFENSKH